MLLQKVKWYERARAINRFHIDKLRENPSWSYRDTAKELNLSVGTICNDLTIASWLVTHEEELIKFKTSSEALEFIKKKRMQLRVRY